MSLREGDSGMTDLNRHHYNPFQWSYMRWFLKGRRLRARINYAITNNRKYLSAIDGCTLILALMSVSESQMEVE